MLDAPATSPSTPEVVLPTPRERLENEPDYVMLKRFGYSLARVCCRYPDGAPPQLVAQALDTTESAIAKRYERIVEELRHALVPSGVRDEM